MQGGALGSYWIILVLDTRKAGTGTDVPAWCGSRLGSWWKHGNLPDPTSATTPLSCLPASVHSYFRDLQASPLKAKACPLS